MSAGNSSVVLKLPVKAPRSAGHGAGRFLPSLRLSPGTSEARDKGTAWPELRKGLTPAFSLPLPGCLKETEEKKGNGL